MPSDIACFAELVYIPPNESFVIMYFKETEQLEVDFPYLLAMIPDSFMSRRNTMVVPGGQMGFSMEIILQPIIERMMDSRDV